MGQTAYWNDEGQRHRRADEDVDGTEASWRGNNNNKWNLAKAVGFNLESEDEHGSDESEGTRKKKRDR
jgi:hypothetical protein